MLCQERHLHLSFRKKKCFYSSPTTIQYFLLKIRGLEFCSFVQTAQEITHNLQNKRKLFLICPTLIPLGQDFFKQFPTPGPKGLNLSWELPGGGGGNRSSWTMHRPCIWHKTFNPPPPISVEKSFMKTFGQLWPTVSWLTISWQVIW